MDLSFLAFVEFEETACPFDVIHYGLEAAAIGKLLSFLQQDNEVVAFDLEVFLTKPFDQLLSAICPPY